MSLNKKTELIEIAKSLSRGLRQNATIAERTLWERLRDNNIENNKFYRQYAIFYDLSGKETFFIADFYCHRTRLVIELDGEYHQYRLAEDYNRTKILNLLGLKVIRFTNKEILENIELVLEKIKNEITPIS